MSKIYTSATQLIGHTPLLKVTNYLKDQNIEGVELLAKLEYFNPAGSVKDRIALAMIEDAEKKGILKEGSNITNIIPTAATRFPYPALPSVLRFFPVLFPIFSL